MKDGRQVVFQTNSYSESDVHKKLVNAISHYSRLRSEASSQIKSLPSQKIDVAEEIAKFAKLKKQGILTDAEFDAKKKQLLDL